MNEAAILQLPVVQITVPLLMGLFVAGWFQNKRIDDVRADLSALRGDMNRQFDLLLAELRAHRAGLALVNERITRMEERLPPPLVRGR